MHKVKHIPAHGKVYRGGVLLCVLCGCVLLCLSCLVYARYGLVVFVEYVQGGCDEGTTCGCANAGYRIDVGIVIYGYKSEVLAFAVGLYGENEAISGFGDICVTFGVTFQCGSYHSSPACVRGLHIGYEIA